MIEWLNLVSLIVSIVATVYLFVLASKTDKGLNKGFVFLAVGVLVAVGVHAGAEYLESIDVLGETFLLGVMPVFVLIGSLSIVWGTYVLYRTIMGVQNEK